MAKKPTKKTAKKVVTTTVMKIDYKKKPKAKQQPKPVDEKKPIADDSIETKSFDEAKSQKTTVKIGSMEVKLAPSTDNTEEVKATEQPKEEVKTAKAKARAKDKKINSEIDALLKSENETNPTKKDEADDGSWAKPHEKEALRDMSRQISHIINNHHRPTNKHGLEDLIALTLKGTELEVNHKGSTVNCKVTYKGFSVEFDIDAAKYW